MPKFTISVSYLNLFRKGCTIILRLQLILVTIVFLNQNVFPFSASYATLWYSTASLCCNVSPWWNICSSIYSSGIFLFRDISQLATSSSCFSANRHFFFILIRDLTPSAPLRCLLQTALLKLQ